MKKQIYFLLGAALLTGCGAVGEAAWSTPPATVATGIGQTFSGTAASAGGDMTVTIWVDGNEITEVNVDHSDTPDFADPAIETLVANVLASQSNGVDSVTGATATSNAFLQALAGAFDAAGLEIVQPDTALATNQFVGVSDGAAGPITVTITVDNGVITAVDADHTDTPDFADPAIDTMIAQVLEAQTATVDAVTGATATSNAFLQALADAVNQADLVTADPATAPAATRFTDGIFVGTGAGAGGDIIVTITVENDIITDVAVEHSDTPDFANPAIDTMVAEVLANQTPVVDAVTGATATANGFLQAIAAATAQAGY